MIPAFFYRQINQEYETAIEYQKTHPTYSVNFPLYRRFKAMVKVLQGKQRYTAASHIFLMFIFFVLCDAME